MAREECPDCDGPAAFGGGNGKCSTCHGEGTSVGKYVADIVIPQDEFTCDDCGGNGVCSTCSGEGYIV